MWASNFRVGQGHDTHRLEAGLPLMLGGVKIPHTHGAVGHSDADVLLHCLTDALFGALAAGDIGEWFPDTDPANKKADSRRFLQAAVEEVRSKGWAIVNVDCTVHLEQPKLAKHKPAIRQSLATLLEIELDRVGLKAKTGEGLGPVGEGRAIVADAVVLLERNPI